MFPSVTPFRQKVCLEIMQRYASHKLINSLLIAKQNAQSFRTIFQTLQQTIKTLKNNLFNSGFEYWKSFSFIKMQKVKLSLM